MATKEFIGKYLSTEISRYLPGFQNIEPVDYLGLDPSRNMVNIIDDLPIGLSSITYFTREDFGGTAIYDLNAEIPMVDFLVSQEKIVSGLAFVTGAKWSIFDLQKYQLAQRNNSNIESRNPVSTKVEIMGNFLSETENNMVLYGASSRQCYGVFNQPDVTVSDQSALGGGNFYSLNSSQVYNYFLEWINAFVRQAKLSSTSAIEILMPERLKALLAKPYDDGTNPIQLNVNIWDTLLSTNSAYNVGRLDSALELEGENLLANGVMPDNTKDRIIFKSNSNVSQNLTIHRHPRQVLTPFQRDSIHYEIMSYSGMTSAYIIKPTLMMYVDIGNEN